MDHLCPRASFPQSPCLACFSRTTATTNNAETSTIQQIRRPSSVASVTSIMSFPGRAVKRATRHANRLSQIISGILHSPSTTSPSPFAANAFAAQPFASLAEGERLRKDSATLPVLCPLVRKVAGGVQ
ncbi:hypothetical protein BDY17DRAFT_326946 [Neohortaea acidophila]|uniref:Uncharacterized protein n=1 Tax=Neohortaea acidophila TaxID=245834 RepID=A0A6A6PIV7_9PEZI|nr:uncharacterized protein BDY17DRAFT_326946 [Neohortaea acidophila]KAF2479949.1 hypothetical protein BDY17DRAFT_326946 [Neohortaea acidophila]